MDKIKNEKFNYIIDPLYIAIANLADDNKYADVIRFTKKQYNEVVELAERLNFEVERMKVLTEKQEKQIEEEIRLNEEGALKVPF